MSAKRASKKSPGSYKTRFYREWLDKSDLIRQTVQVQETDLSIHSTVAVADQARELIIAFRLQLETYINSHHQFLTSLTPLTMDPLAPPIIKEMMKASQLAGVGPMASVAGAMSEGIGKHLVDGGCSEIMIENGGDLYLQRQRDVTVAVYAGESPLSNKVAIKIEKNRFPCGVCTSSGAIGHSLSMGVADSVTVVAKSTPLADAAATRLGNEIRQAENMRGHMEAALELARTIEGVDGALIICNEMMGAVGDVELVQL